MPTAMTYQTLTAKKLFFDIDIWRYCESNTGFLGLKWNNHNEVFLPLNYSTEGIFNH